MAKINHFATYGYLQCDHNYSCDGYTWKEHKHGTPAKNWGDWLSGSKDIASIKCYGILLMWCHTVK